MERRYFRLTIDEYVKGRWYLGEPTDLNGQELDDIWAFIDGKQVPAPGQLRIPLSRPGFPLDFDLTTFAMTPVVTEQVAAVFREMAPSDVQLFRVEVEGQRVPYYLMNVARTARCIDESACEEVQIYTAKDGRPDRIGEYRAVSGLRIDKSKVGGARVFRLWGWHPPIIVDGELKQALEQVGIVGGCFEEV